MASTHVCLPEAQRGCRASREELTLLSYSLKHMVKFVYLPLEIISATELALICSLWRPLLTKPASLWIKEVNIKNLPLLLFASTNPCRHAFHRVGSWPWGTLSLNTQGLHQKKQWLPEVQILTGSSHKNLSVYALKQKRAMPGQILGGKAVPITSFLHWRLLLSYHSPIWKHQLLRGLDASASLFSTLTGFCLHWNLQLEGLDHELRPYSKLWSKAKAGTAAAIMNSLLAVLSYRGVPSNWSAFPSLWFGWETPCQLI